MAAGSLWLVIAGAILPAETSAATGPPDSVQLSDVSVTRAGAEVLVHLRVDGPGPPDHRSFVLRQPPRVVIDLERATYGWQHRPLTAAPAPVRQIRGSQWKPGVARVVVELSEPATIRVEEAADGVVVALTPIMSAASAAASPAPARTPSDAVAPGPALAAVSERPDRLAVKGHVQVGSRHYLTERGTGLYDDSAVLEGEVDLSWWLSDALRFRLRPRLAVEPPNHERNRYEPLDAYLEYADGRWAFLAGQLVENWGITDTFNPTDVLNRRDLERDFYDPERLGEVVLRLRWFLPEALGIQQPALAVYFLPLHRDTPLPGRRDRFRFDVDGDDRGDLGREAVVASPEVAYAARLSASVGRADLFLSYFGGPTRIPSFDLAVGTDLQPLLTPVYYLVDMIGGGVQWALGPWLLKLEAAYTFTKTAGLPRRLSTAVPSSFFQFVIGVDRTFTDVLGKNEVTVTVEYAGEDHPRQSSIEGLRPYKSDVFLGVRWNFNDERRSELQASVAVDVLVNEQIWLASFSTALWRDLRLVLHGQFVNRAPDARHDRFTTFNVFPNNSNLQAALRYEF